MKKMEQDRLNHYQGMNLYVKNLENSLGIERQERVLSLPSDHQCQGDDRGRPAQGLVWVFFLSRRGNEGCDRDEWVHAGHQVAVRDAGSAQRRMESYLDQPVHSAAPLPCVGPGGPPLGFFPAALQLLPAHWAPVSCYTHRDRRPGGGDKSNW